MFGHCDGLNHLNLISVFLMQFLMVVDIEYNHVKTVHLNHLKFPIALASSVLFVSEHIGF